MNRMLGVLCVSLVLFFHITPLAWAEKGGHIPLFVPGTGWALEVYIPGKFNLEQQEVAPNGEAARFFGGMPDTNVMVSAFIEKAPRKGGASDCRAHYWELAKKSPFIKKDIRQYEFKGFALVDYMVPEFEEMTVNQKNINAYVVVDDYWIDIHISKVLYEADDDTLIHSILENTRINRQFETSTEDNLYFGHMLFSGGQYKKAIPFLEKALEQEGRIPTLSEDAVKVLMDLLGMAYGITGDLKNAESIFQRGLKIYPEYPMFYYNLACVYADLNDLDKVILNLKKAFEYQKNMIRGEQMSDPAKDPSFSKFMTNKTFIEALDRMKLKAGMLSAPGDEGKNET